MRIKVTRWLCSTVAHNWFTVSKVIVKFLPGRQVLVTSCRHCRAITAMLSPVRMITSCHVIRVDTIQYDNCYLYIHNMCQYADGGHFSLSPLLCCNGHIDWRLAGIYLFIIKIVHIKRSK